MNVTVHVPSMLRGYSNGESKLSVTAPTLGVALDQIKRDHRGLYDSVCDETGTVRRHVNVFVNESNMRDLEGLDTQLAPGDVLTIMPAVSGGSTWPTV